MVFVFVAVVSLSFSCGMWSLNILPLFSFPSTRWNSQTCHSACSVASTVPTYATRPCFTRVFSPKVKNTANLRSKCARRTDLSSYSFVEMTHRYYSIYFIWLRIFYLVTPFQFHPLFTC
jgi:hypothetical protein